VAKATISVSEELRQAADKLANAEGSGCCAGDAAAKSREQFAGLLRAVANIHEDDPTWSDRHPVALDIARGINRTAVTV
jgi:hypothetical protein